MNGVRRWASVGLAGVGVLAFAACSDSNDVTGPGGGDQLSEAEAAAISEFLVSHTFSEWDFSDVGGGAALRVGDHGATLSVGDAGVAFQSTPVTIDYQTSVDLGCPLGGSLGVSIDVQGTIDDETGSGDLSLEAVTSATACGVEADGTGFTLDTNPDLTLTGAFAFSNGQLVGDASFTYTGAVSWDAEDGRSGSCAYDVAVTVSDTGTAVTSGTLCGTSL